MNILFCVEVDWIRKPVYDMQLLAESMSVIGHKVYAVDYESMWDAENNINELDVSVALSNAKVHLIRPKFMKIPILSRVSAFASHYSAIRKVIKEKKIDAIILYAVPTNGLQAVYWAKKFNIPIIFRSIDILNQLVRYPILKNITGMLERFVYPKVDRILTISPKLSDYVIKMGAKPENVGYLPMTLNTELFHFRNTNGYREKWGLELDDKVMLFMGTLFNFSGLDKFISLMPQIILKIPNAKLLIVGDGEQRQELENLIDELELKDHVIITGFKPYQDMPLYINASDVCINTFLDTPTTRDIFPGKTVQFLACEKPLVATGLAGMKAVVSGEDQGVIYVDDLYSMVEPIINLLESRKKRDVLGEKGGSYVYKEHNSLEVARKLEKELELLINAKKTS